MHQNKQIRTANLLRNIARYTLLVIGVLLFLFALASGADGYGGGIHGIIKNSPNALPWLALLIFLVIAWKWELVGGILITVLGLFVTGFMAFRLMPSRDNVFLIIPLILFLFIILLGIFFIISWRLRQKNES